VSPAPVAVCLLLDQLGTATCTAAAAAAGFAYSCAAADLAAADGVHRDAAHQLLLLLVYIQAGAAEKLPPY
jgi:hypothetical protein